MSDFRKLGNSIVDMDQVRLVGPSFDGVKHHGIRVTYNDMREEWIDDENPVETVAAFHAEYTRHLLSMIPARAIQDAPRETATTTETK